MNNTDSPRADLDKSTHDAFVAHMEYASKTIASWPSWKQNILAHTRPIREADSTARPSEENK